MNKDRCDKCKFGEAVSERVKCRRFPPSSDGNGHKSKDTQPMMMTDDWCGEFKGGKQ